MEPVNGNQDDHDGDGDDDDAAQQRFAGSVGVGAGWAGVEREMMIIDGIIGLLIGAGLAIN
ncbi:hypothetical protein EJ05DRAFT_477314 [Pseudovirgaria hyperparasitica]|uniref:Uncharacterized protein n=1 Tax=Pseudovirgaria hyperparasitica TaxID=470096 RepID=A0A6A6W4J4_9PEZI|nr:uncharacterized protein EJ05DRAFT_477314 [Pseudovirgaria hyperparasitica]KAF2757089.1 hypothetical protein EJ05DRAFT_477314 [Pseudovirgaria hyperparasitica]